MSKQKEFWIVDNGEEPCLAFQDKENEDEIKTYKIHYHVRTVNPALDEAIEGLVEALEWYEKNSTDQQCCNNGVQVGEQEWACCNQPITMAGISLAAYKAAKEGEK